MPAGLRVDRAPPVGLPGADPTRPEGGRGGDPPRAPPIRPLPRVDAARFQDDRVQARQHAAAPAGLQDDRGRPSAARTAPPFTAASARFTAGAQLHSAPGLTAVFWACAVCANGGGGREIAAARRRPARISRTATQGDVPLPRQHHALPFFISLRRLPTSLVPRSPGRTRSAV